MLNMNYPVEAGKILPLYLTIDELRIIEKFLRHEFISYENLPMLRLIEKIAYLVKQDDLARQNATNKETEK